MKKNKRRPQSEGVKMKHLYLADSDKELLVMLHDFVYLDLAFIMEYIFKDRFSSQQAARARMKTLADAGYIKMFKGVALPDTTQPGLVYTLTSTGVAMVEELQGYSNFRAVWTKELAVWYRHTLQIARVVKKFMDESPKFGLQVKDYISESRAFYQYGANKSEVIRPDGFMVIGGSESDENFGIFLEMERSISKKHVIQSKIERYQEFLEYPAAKEKYLYKTGAEAEATEWLVLFIGNDDRSTIRVMKIMAKIKPKPGEQPSIQRPDINIPVLLGSTNDIMKNPVGANYHHMYRDDYETKDMIYVEG